MKKLKFIIPICILAVVLFVPSIFQKDTTLYTIIKKGATDAMQVKAMSTNTNDGIPTIVIDAGHGGYDTGSISYDGIFEKDINLQVALKTGAILEEQGFHVIYTRTSDEVSWSNDNKEDLQARVNIGEDSNADYFISIHTNASDYDDGAYGFETFLNYENANIEQMAENIEKNFTSLNFSMDRGLKSTQDSSLYVIDKNSVPAMLIELGFITDSDDASYMTSESGQNNLAQSIASGIIDTLS